MKINKFLNIDIEPAPPELELSVEMRCREIMESEDYDNIKRYCTHLIRHQMKQDVFIASMLGRLVELEANLVVQQVKAEKKTNPLKKFFRIP
ncbi:hypothetical protein [uncultured Mediterranean phage uvMED]|nr:hypothetical protein [uncultured Mediterranean phage uvMED]BAR22191.1 unnamed protein product [uncultured Mediterranean phage uvMED]BAR22201.1 unnamed protein product [uncultured Mediterranean phage uvMED]BAR22285.1 unnamed protein product [uncultured Mediterranean phage uvMED]BAR22287.1 unnamed protein product [uncultured Mediterranean phage uvMED]